MKKTRRMQLKIEAPLDDKVTDYAFHKFTPRISKGEFVRRAISLYIKVLDKEFEQNEDSNNG